MKKDLFSQAESSSTVPIVSDGQFSEWVCINDTIMGGSSQADCKGSLEGLLLRGDIVEDGGGFVSCCSPELSPPLNLSRFRGLRLAIDADGRNFKFALASKNSVLSFAEFLTGGIRWVSEFQTKPSGTTYADIFFSDLMPTVRAKPVKFPLSFDSSMITQFQLLHSKFGNPGKLNSRFRSGSIKILLRSICGIL